MRIGSCSICLLISIHTPHIGSDIVRHMIYAYLTNFNPRSTHRERRCLPLHHSHCPLISIHAPRRGERPTSFAMVANCTPFQSTLPAGGATPRESAQRLEHLFQSTLPAGGATTDIAIKAIANMISIHAPRMGSDSTVKAYSNDRIKWSTLREPHFLYSKNACFSPIVSMCAATSRTKKSENQSFIRIISRLGTYVFHLRLVSVPQIIEPYAVRLLVHQHFQCSTK